MCRLAKRNTMLAVIAAGLMVLGTATSAAAWGGPTNFDGGNCSKYSIASNSANNAGANTVLSYGPTGIKVGFRGGGHLWIAPVSGSSVAMSFISQSVVNTYGVTGASHQCGSGNISYS